ncbi:eCIS core domain-containing protein [Occallatibacter riparius]|uniref:DUF4157 domain-containing protein n=1 Tax=Occallatibacter riparius TaxID=1002689 RepID=A0A9J7BIW7_9BACT|nr:DUF4157 domain-containing protein [Occallatibacter riparius]UWZ81738.1 DUF4157 domain-containing protein [Occallatibacter riparius]
MLKAANRLRTPAPNIAQRLHRSPDRQSHSAEPAYSGNRALLRQLSRSGPVVRRDPPADAKKTPPAPATPAAGPAPSPTPDAGKTDEVKLTIPWDEILKGNTTLLQVLMPGLQPPAPGSGAATPAPAGPSPAPAGPTAGTSTPPPSAPTPAPAAPAPDAPSRLSLKDFGNLSLGLRLGFPDMKTSNPYDASPSALQQSIQAGELINYSMTGKLPSAYQLDKGKLVGACWGIFSKYIAPDFAAKIAKGMSGKTAGGGISYELDGVLLPDFSGGGLSFTLKFGAKAPYRPSTTPDSVQPKLKVGSTTDPLEAEADRAADQVMRMPAPASEGILQRKCAACEEEDKVRTKSNGQGEAEGNAPPIVSHALSSPGQALDTNTRAFFEKRFDADFSQVRIHKDSLAAQSADAVNARAYATGNHIVLGAGETSSPTHLLAHELAHVVQQSGDSDTSPEPTLSRAPKPGHCGGVWSCAYGTACETPDVAAGSGASTNWQLELNIDTDVESSDDIMSGDDVGHTYLVFTESNGAKYSYGFYPNPLQKPDVIHTSVPGCVVHPDTAHASCVDYSKKYTLTQAQHTAALQFAQLLCKGTPPYDLFKWNCTTAAVEIAKRAGQTPPPAKGSVGHGATTADNPNTLKEGYLDQDVPTRHLTSDSDIRTWVAAHTTADFQKIATAEKARLLNRLLEGWISDEDIAAFESICKGIVNDAERTALQTATKSHVDDMSSSVQQSRVHAALYPGIVAPPAAGVTAPTPPPPTR